MRADCCHTFLPPCCWDTTLADSIKIIPSSYLRGWGWCKGLKFRGSGGFQVGFRRVPQAGLCAFWGSLLLEKSEHVAWRFSVQGSRLAFFRSITMLQGFSCLSKQSMVLWGFQEGFGLCAVQVPRASDFRFGMEGVYRTSWTNSVTPHPQLYTTISTTKRAKTKACVMSPWNLGEAFEDQKNQKFGKRSGAPSRSMQVSQFIFLHASQDFGAI